MQNRRERKFNIVKLHSSFQTLGHGALQCLLGPNAADHLAISSLPFCDRQTLFHLQTY